MCSTTTWPGRAWAYSAASSRIRIAPDIASTGGGLLYDELYVLQGAPDLFDSRLLGKREMYLPDNNYRLMCDVPGSTLMMPQFINPDLVLRERHRVWVAEATLKPGKRQLLQRRTYFLDEDWGGAGISDGYDAAGKLVRGMFQGFVPLYDVQTPMVSTFWGYDLNSGLYASVVPLGDPGLGLWIKSRWFPALHLYAGCLAEPERATSEAAAVDLRNIGKMPGSLANRFLGGVGRWTKPNDWRSDHFRKIKHGFT